MATQYDLYFLEIHLTAVGALVAYLGVEIRKAENGTYLIGPKEFQTLAEACEEIERATPGLTR